MFGGMAKWVDQIDDVARIPEYISRAFHVATSGRPGPVVLALPEDMLEERATVADCPPYRRSGACPDAGDMAAIVTNGWHLVASHPHGGGERPARLFAKPDDYFELSDVADRCAAVADELEQALEPVWRGAIPEAYARPLPIEATTPS
jgi:hypothetical protein